MTFDLCDSPEQLMGSLVCLIGTARCGSLRALSIPKFSMVGGMVSLLTTTAAVCVRSMWENSQDQFEYKLEKALKPTALEMVHWIMDACTRQQCRGHCLPLHPVVPAPG